MRRLKELGVDDSSASMYWKDDEGNVGDVPAFTLHDVLNMLPKQIENNKLVITYDFSGSWNIFYGERFSYVIEFVYEDIFDAAYEMLCWCAENGYIKTNNKQS